MRRQVKKKKSWWSTFLKPGWILFTIFVIAFTYFAFTWLAPWQLNKDDDIVERNHQLEAAFEADPVPYQEVFNDDGTIPADREWSRVTMTGQYLTDDEVLLRMRPVASGPSYQSLVPFETNQGDIILVNRGWVNAGEGNTVPDDLESAPTGEVTLLGMVRFGENVHPNEPIEREGYWQSYSINANTIEEITGLEGIGDDYVQLNEDQPGVLNPVPVPSMDRGNHLSYGYQWIAFGIMAPIGLGYFIYSEIRERRRAEEEQAELEAMGSDGLSTKTGDSKNDTDPADDSYIHPENLSESFSEDRPASAQDSSDVREPSESEPKTEPEEPAAAKNSGASARRRARYGDAHPDHYAKFNKRSQDRA
ncbi:SURF1 family protein [Corynebacterium sp. L4756]|uniref:SURF1 family cytochrome oxidase biogenesis protein n=1 Tax=unclassified Corynebacterium TaxID=2624378 RepID=UPI00374CA083